MRNTTQTRRAYGRRTPSSKERSNKNSTIEPENAKEDRLDVIGADIHFDEVVEAARDGGVDVILTIYELERYIDAQDRREELIE